MDVTDAHIEDLISRIRAWHQEIKAGTAAAPPPVVQPNPQVTLQGLDTSRMICTFDERFDALDFTRWSTVYRWNQRDGYDAPDIRGSSLPTEKAWYINRTYPPTVDLRPWRIENGELVLTADRLPQGLVPQLGYDQSDLRNLGFYQFSSGLLHTGTSFLQQYGYFEAEMKWPAGKGLWPAFWLLPHKGKPPEIDIMEVLGERQDLIYHTLHSAAGREHIETFIAAGLGYHRIGVLWTPEKIAWYVDGSEVGSKPTPADAHVPMYMILNLAVGGPDSWGGAPDYFTQFPAEMRVREVRAFRL